MAKGILKKINKARTKVEKEISAIARSGSHIGSALSGEGYSAGYRDALDDIKLLLNGVTPNRRNYYESDE